MSLSRTSTRRWRGSAFETALPDGVYQVTADRFCAGFVAKGGRVTDCAPILRANLEYWVKVARRIDEHLGS
jgi:hypothetical protein